MGLGAWRGGWAWQQTSPPPQLRWVTRDAVGGNGNPDKPAQNRRQPLLEWMMELLP